MNDVSSEEAESKENKAGTELAPASVASDLAPDVAAEGEADTQALAIATEGGPVVAEIELQPLALRPILPPSMQEIAVAQPAAGFWGRYRLFIVSVVLPMLIASLYLFVVAAPRFASSASFIVRAVTPSSPQPSIAGALVGQSSSQTPGAGQSGLQATVGSGQPSAGAGAVQSGSQAPASLGSTIAEGETYAINAYLNSRDVVDQLAKNDNLRGVLNCPEGDFLFRYPTFWLPNDSEFLYQRFQWMVSASVDPDTLITTIEVNAFTPEDAHRLATAMLEYAEGLVNQMNQRSFDNGLAVANRFVADATKEVDSAEADLKAYRNASGSIDPQAVAASKLQVISGLTTQLAQIQATIAQQAALAPRSPSLASLRAQAQSYRREIEKRNLEIAGSSGSEFEKLATYDELTTRRDLVAKALALAVAQRDEARQDVQRQHLFIQVISSPNLSSDYARYPQVALDLLILLAICLVVFNISKKGLDTTER